jgi:hypothetical protein
MFDDRKGASFKLVFPNWRREDGKYWRINGISFRY